MMRLLDLFSGIGGFSLGLERSGHFRTVAFCEINAYCRRVLARHWPGVPCYGAIEDLTAARLATDGIGPIDAICGGFPCQDISGAGSGQGIEGSRSGLWFEYARLIREIRPGIVFVENVALLRARGLGRVLGDLATLGFDAEWHSVPAAAVGARHRRDRVWVVAYAASLGWRQGRGFAGSDRPPAGEGAAVVAGHGCPALADAIRAGFPLAERGALQGPGWREAWGAIAQCGWWAAEPDVGRVAYGVPKRVDRLRSLGNSLVPQIPEMIGRAIGWAIGQAGPTMEVKP